jgi:hypothetical protein
MPEQSNLKTVILQPLDSVLLPATTEPFVVRDHFKKPKDVKFSTVWNEFKKRFFEKIENPRGETTYRKYKLLKITADGPIIAELGGASKVEGTISAVFALLQRQGNGGPGFLQTNGYANIFYVRDMKDALCAVRTGWTEDGWVIDAISVEDPLAWNGKHEIFCPVSSTDILTG